MVYFSSQIGGEVLLVSLSPSAAVNIEIMASMWHDSKWKTPDLHQTSLE